MKTIYLGFHDLEDVYNKKKGFFDYKIHFDCPYCGQHDTRIFESAKGKFIQVCEECGQTFKVEYNCN